MSDGGDEVMGRPMSEDKGVKHDQGKSRLDLIPPEALFAMAEVLGFGANKYGDRNWELGIDPDRLYAALQRHLWAWWGGEEEDEESLLPHLWHALAGISMLITLQQRGKA